MVFIASLANFSKNSIQISGLTLIQESQCSFRLISMDSQTCKEVIESLENVT